MAAFSFDKFMNTINNIKADTITELKMKISIEALASMNDLCPSSYMPFFFIDAAYANCIKFIGFTNDRTISSELTIKSETVKNFLILNGNLRQDFSSAIIDEPRPEKIITNKDLMRTLYASIFDNLISSLITPEGKKSFNAGWDFHEYDEDGDLCVHDDSKEPYSNSFLNAEFELLKEHDTFFKTEFDRFPYFLLANILITCKLDVPNDNWFQFTTINDVISYYFEQKRCYEFYDSLIMSIYKLNHGEYIPIPNGITKIINGLFLDADIHAIYDPFCNLGQFALNVNPQMASLNDIKTPLKFISDEQSDEAICAVSARLMFRGCEVKFVNHDVNIKQPVYFVSMPSIDKQITYKGRNISSIEFALIKGMECVNHGGKMACLVPSYVLTSKDYKEVMSIIINSPFETKIICFPKKTIASTQIAMSIIYVNGHKNSGTIKFIDAYDHVASKEDFNEFSSTSISPISSVLGKEEIGGIYKLYHNFKPVLS